MSTATFPMFKSASVEELPRLACIGFIEEVKDVKPTAKGVYTMIPFVISPAEAGRKAFGNFMFRPDWMVAGFDPDSLKQYENGKSLTAVYRINVHGSKDVSTLNGIAGSEEGFLQLAGEIFKATENQTEDDIPGIVRDVIAEYVRENQPTIGYYLGQRSEKNEATGQYELRDGYELKGFFHVTDEERKRLAKQAAAGKLVLTFEQN